MAGREDGRPEDDPTLERGGESRLAGALLIVLVCAGGDHANPGHVAVLARHQYHVARNLDTQDQMQLGLPYRAAGLWPAAPLLASPPGPGGP